MVMSIIAIMKTMLVSGFISKFNPALKEL